jgi:hypothetical protein
MSLAPYEELPELDPFAVRFAAGSEVVPLAVVLFVVAVPLAAPFVREELFLLAPPRWEVFATQLPFSPFNERLDLRDPAWKVLADKRVEASRKFT